MNTRPVSWEYQVIQSTGEVADFGRFMTISSIPDTCSVCHTSSILRRAVEFLVRLPRHMQDYQTVMQCTSGSCGQLLVVSYHEGETGLHLTKIEPATGATTTVSDEIQKISPRFKPLLEQAVHAEAGGMPDLAGMGYGKAAEILIKDYAIHKNPDKRTEIENMLLGQVIKNHVDDNKVKTVSERAAWLRNDEVHYKRKWENKDINDLKKLLAVVQNWIESDIITDQLEEDMPHPGKN